METESNMEVIEKVSSIGCYVKKDDDEDDDDVPLPGFRFHPTDEELVGFYLRRKVEKRPISIELIKQVDIYKYDPWDLPKAGNGTDKEWYFFCKRGRKYRNSIRPNRVTGSGFWKATGIDKPIYSSTSNARECIGLKKSLVYYRGSAGKGTKTDWMMHEFRLPTDQDERTTKHIDVKNIAHQEAEVWTLCRILKRSISYSKCIPDWREVAAKKNHVNATPKTYNVESNNRETYINFNDPINVIGQNEKKQFVNHLGETNQMPPGQLINSVPQPQAPYTTSESSTFSRDMNEFIQYGDWDELRPIVGLSVDPFLM